MSEVFSGRKMANPADIRRALKEGGNVQYELVAAEGMRSDIWKHFSRIRQVQIKLCPGWLHLSHFPTLSPRTPANPLLFWRSQGHRYPKLARVARSIFAIPASSAQVLICLTCKAITVFPPSFHAIFLRLSGTSPRPGQPSQPKEATSNRPDWSSSSCLAVQARLR